MMCLLLSGCLVGPNYQRPYIDAPESYHFLEGDETGTLNIEWWHQFGDPVLDSLILEALENNKDVKIAAANIEKAAGVVLQVNSQLFPQIGYNGLINRQRLSQTTATPIPPTVPNPQTLFQLVGTGSWQIDLWGRIQRETQSAVAQYFATIEGRRGIILSLVASVANSYLQLRGLDEQLVISENTKDIYGEELKYFQLQYEHGQVSELLVAQAETQYEIAAAKIPDIQLQIVTLENAISILLGRNPGPIARGKSIKELPLIQVPEGIPSCILTQRPDIRQAEDLIMAVNAQIGAAKALYFPDITLTGALGGASEQLKNLFKGPSRVWSYTESIVGPILTFGAIYGQVIQAEAQTLAAIISYKLAIQKAFADVENALAARMLLTDELQALGRLVEAATQYVYLSKLQYDGGYSPYFVVIQAQQQLFPAELSWVQSRVQLLSSLVNIYQALGGGWVYMAEELTY